MHQWGPMSIKLNSFFCFFFRSTNRPWCNCSCLQTVLSSMGVTLMSAFKTCATCTDLAKLLARLPYRWWSSDCYNPNLLCVHCLNSDTDVTWCWFGEHTVMIHCETLTYFHKRLPTLHCAEFMHFIHRSQRWKWKITRNTSLFSSAWLFLFTMVFFHSWIIPCS